MREWQTFDCGVLIGDCGFGWAEGREHGAWGRGQRAESMALGAEGREHGAWGRGQRAWRMGAEGRGQGTEDRRQMTKVKVSSYTLIVIRYWPLFRGSWL